MPEAILGNFYWPGASGSLLVLSPVLVFYVFNLLIFTGRINELIMILFHFRPKAILELETQKAEVDGMLVSLDTKIDTLDLLQQGKVPEAPHIEARPIVFTEPEIRTVEVRLGI